MQANIRFQGKDDEPVMTDFIRPIIDLTSIQSMTFCAVEGGMQNGDPSVVIGVETFKGTFMAQTSLDKFLAAAKTMASGAEYHWGWTVPEGYADIIPIGKEARKKMLEDLVKQLQELEAAEDEEDKDDGTVEDWTQIPAPEVEENDNGN